jgi:hypothetical protein
MVCSCRKEKQNAHEHSVAINIASNDDKLNRLLL